MITISCTATSSGIAVILQFAVLIDLLRPENILYRTKDPESDIVIADFGMYAADHS